MLCGGTGLAFTLRYGARRAKDCSEKAYVARSVDDPCASGGLPEGLNAEQRNRGKLASVFIDTLASQPAQKKA